jgi:histidine triad (HIT) family protein
MENKHDENCIFCKIIKGEIPSYKIYEDEEILAFLDAFPTNKGHTLIIPKTHVENIFEVDTKTLQNISKKAQIISKNIKEKLNCHGINILQNNGKQAGQDVFHYHMHIIPRYEDDNVRIKFNSQHEMITPEIANKIIKELK